MNNDQQLEPNGEEEVFLVASRPPTEKELFYLEWGKEMVKNQVNLANEILKQIMTLCVALLSVSVIFEKLFENEPGLKFFTVLMLFISLIFACVGIYPFEKSDVWLNSPSEVERFKIQALNFKKQKYKLSVAFLLLGIAVIVLTVLKQMYSN